MTISPKSRFYGACLNLPRDQRASMVRKAVAIACLRTFSNMELSLKSYLTFSSPENQLFDWDETTAGSIASQMTPATGKFPTEIGNAVIECGVLHPKLIKSTVIDIIYQDSHATNDLNNELVYLFGHQLEHLFDPLAEYSPEPTEMLYSPPSYPPMQRPSDNQTVQSVCEELFSLQSHFTTDLLSMLQDFLIPLRVKVLGGDIPGVNMRKLNMIFPPTIDEIVRVNNILYEALDLAMPYGSYEVIKACGISIPYFYKACMRHEAATRNFAANLREHIELIQMYSRMPGRFTVNRMESIIHCSLHLTKIKMVLDRLVKIVKWRDDELANVDEFYQSAVGTIDSFGRENFISPYDNRIFTPTGKLLVEISKGWPKELEYGWINRRVVTIFDASDVMGRHDVFNVIFIFTDSVVIIRPSEPVSITSDSGIHKPSIADMLMHSMVNSVPLPNLPELNVVGWAPIEDVYMAEFGGPQSLAMYITGSGLSVGNKTCHLQIYKLIRPEVTSNAIVNYISKAKIMNKTQPFHLFLNKQADFSTFATVQEYNGYLNESRKCPIAVFSNMNIPDAVLDAHDLIACIETQVYGNDHIAISVVSKLAYGYREIVSKSDFSAILSSQVSKLYSLYFASSNPFAAEMIIQNNTLIANYLIDYATTRSPPVRQKSHRSSRGPAKVTIATPLATPTLKRQPSLRERISPVLSKISRKVSTDLMRRNSDTKKRRSFPFLGRSSPVSRRPNADPSKILSTISLPVQNVMAKPSVATMRHSYPSHAPSSEVQVTSPPKTNAVPTHLPPSVLSPSQEDLVVQRKTSFSLALNSPLQQGRYVRNIPSQDIVSNASSQYSLAVKDSERFSDSFGDFGLVSGRTAAERHSMPPERYMETIESDSGTPSRAGTPTNGREDEFTIGEVTLSSPPTPNARSLVGHSFTDSLIRSLSSVQDLSRTSSSGSSVENWYQDLNNRRDESLDSLDSHTAPPIDVNETTLDDEEDLTQSMKNLTMFIDKQPPRRMISPNLPMPNVSGSESSVLLSDDFAYLAGMVEVPEQVTRRTGSLYPDIQESSLVFLGNYIHSRDGSEMLINGESAESLGLKRQQEQELSAQDLFVPSKPVFVSEHEWLSTTGSSSSSQGDQVAAYLRGEEHQPEPSYITENLTVYSDSSSNFSDSDDLGGIIRSGRQAAQQRANRVPRGLSTSNLTSSELQLRSLTVNIDSLIHEECADVLASPPGPGQKTTPPPPSSSSSIAAQLEHVSFTVLRLHRGTNGLVAIPPSVPELQARDQHRVIRVEQQNRRLLMSCLWTLIGAQAQAAAAGTPEKAGRYRMVVESFLDLEWHRRTTMHEKMGRAMPVLMWGVRGS